VIRKNIFIKTWIFPKADNYVYYSPQLICDVPSGQTKPVECSDPDYQTKQEEMDKKNRSSQKQNNAAQAIAMILVASPVFYYHWRLARKEA
jgi:hypothetical protein